MIDFIEYVVGELKSKRLDKANALSLIKQFSSNVSKPGAVQTLHPLLHANTSDLSGQSYSAELSANAFFLDHHRVGQQRVLPGVAYLEMARAAIVRALGQQDLPFDWQLQNVVWAQPFIVEGDSRQIDIALYAELSSDDALEYIEFEISSLNADERVIHCQGSAVYAPELQAQSYDLAALKAQMNDGTMGSDEVYSSYQKVGLNFGPGHQAIETIYQGQQQVLAQMSVPNNIGLSPESFVLHPSLMDGALQAAIGLVEGMTEQQSLPFALDGLTVYGPCNDNVYALLRYANGSQAGDKIIKLDIDLIDDEGNLCAQMRGFSTRIVGQGIGLAAQKNLLLARPQWQVENAPAEQRIEFAAKHVVLCDVADIDEKALANKLSDCQITKLDSNSKDQAARYTDISLALFEQVKTIMQQGKKGKVLLQLVFENTVVKRIYSGLGGLLKTASLENPNLLTQMVIVEHVEQLAEQLTQDSKTPNEQILLHWEGDRKVIRWEDMSAEPLPTPVVFKENGVYLITGGLGGLGILFCQEILAKTEQAKVILTGRSALSAETQALVDELNQGSNRVVYQALDLNSSDEVAKLFENHKGINGIIHSAGMLCDNFILKKSAEEFASVLHPKVTGTYNLDMASRELPLDFFVLFSSGASALGNPGQSDYAVANGYMNSFAGFRNTLASVGKRKGQAIAFNWPLWQDGGMGVDATAEATLRQATGMSPMQTDIGMLAFYSGFSMAAHQVLVGEGDLNVMRQKLLQIEPQQQVEKPAVVEIQPTPVEKNVTVAVKPAEGISLTEQTRDYISKELASLLKMPAHKIDATAPLENYGIDSILAMELTNQLEKTFGSLSKTLFFEYQTLADLTGYFVSEHQEKLQQLFEVTETVETAVTEKPAVASKKAPVSARRFARKASEPQPISAPVVKSEPIAIVGLSGRYPESWDVDALWQNLKTGKDCIVEIPKERWDWQDYYSEDRTKAGHHFSKWGGFIEGVDEFDPLFFNISPREAHVLDPQERLFLQHAWMAMEDAGLNRAALQIPSDKGMPAQIGVYVGVMYGEYQLFGAESSLKGERRAFSTNLATIANRISYVLNLHGPSMMLDTMCSSSLTAIHLACQDLKLGNTELGIAGGVNVTIHPNKYLMLSAGQFISSQGQCQSFGEGGDGYIPGEGVGAVVLKRLSDAERDGHPIYGLITGTALSHGGKTNGPSVPNPQAQSSVIYQALKDADTDPRHVSYIEAHGTGTKLGDPIEIAALTKVFHENNKDTGYCLIGSAKSNIGHTESAAGIAGLTKVLLQMKHQQVVPSLHSAKLNPHIDFAATPFIVNQELTDWQQPVVDGKTIPRIAGISSFGAGGSNAHIVIQEYTAKATASEFETPVAIVLSARTAEQLQQKVTDLSEFVAKGLRIHQAPDLAALAYTLQVGREALEHRLALLVDDISELNKKLGRYVDGDRDIDDLFIGEVEKDNEGMTHLSQDEDMQAAIERWVARRKLGKLLDLWVKGLELDWQQLYAETKPKRISLPTYPFARDRYWAVGDDIFAPAATSTATAVLHPLLHSNTSDLARQSYRSTFTGEEFFLNDHQVRPQGGKPMKVLPAVAYLEMIREAIEQASPNGAAGLTINHSAWAQPIVVDSAKDVHIALYAQDAQNIEFEVFSNDTGVEVSHCQGKATLGEVEGQIKLDLEQLGRQMKRGQIEAERFYRGFASMGIEYGEGYQGVTRIAQGDNQLLAHISLPTAVAQNRNDYQLHPSLLDSALQASLGLVEDFDNLGDDPALPFALDALHILAPCQRDMVAWVRYSPGSSPGDSIIKLDIDLCDSEGKVCVQMHGFTSRVLSGDIAETPSVTLVAEPVWTAPWHKADTNYSEQHVLLCGLANVDAGALNAIQLSSSDSIAQSYNQHALAIFEHIQGILKAKPSGKVRIQVAVSDERYLGLAGLLQTATMENPNIHAQVILVDENISTVALRTQLDDAPGDAIIHNDKALHWQVVEGLSSQPAVAFKDGGTYLITGGLGGLGKVFAKTITDTVNNATVVLTGRSAIKPEQQKVLDSLSQNNCQVLYRQLDINNLEQVKQLVGEFSGLNGIMHSAGMIDDNFIISKSSEQFSKVLEPKVTGTYHLDMATAELDLDFLALFSSMASVAGNPGQSDYATANGFMDHYAHYRNGLVAKGERKGQTLSLNWPLWAEGGMTIDAKAQALMKQTSGMVPLQTENGLKAFYQSLAQGFSQTMVMEGDSAMLRARLAPPAPEPVIETPVETAQVETVDGDVLLGKTESYLKEQLSELLKMPSHQINAKAALEDYGIDSVMVMSLTNMLEKTFGSLSKTLFFEYQTISALTGYFVNNHAAQLSQVFATDKPAEAEAVAVPQATVSKPAAPVRVRSLSAPTVQTTPSVALQSVAIIGMSGRYPEAEDLDQFWQNLCDGKDSITEIPQDRWDVERYFDPHRGVMGKSYSKWGGFITDVDKFDPLFFNISPKEAELIDPQERLFMQTVWHAIEDAGYSKEAIGEHKVGVYVGVMWGQYELYGSDAILKGDSPIPTSSYASVANRISYFFNFNGPSMAIDTMCSSSLTATHLAFEAIRRGEIEVAITGGVNVTIHPHKYLSLSQGNFQASDGRCRSFGEGGDGYVSGEGVGALVLKGLDAALEDGDHVYGLVKASAVNHGGKTNGYSVPNPNAQGDLILAALKQADINPTTLSYIETHGTGTSLGDPIEITGLNRAFGEYTNETRFCPIGSVKSNIGHLESAAGVAAMTKVLLQLKHNQLVPSLHADPLNPNIDFANSHFYVQTELDDWAREGETPRRVGVSSFGAGGSNAHIIIEEFVDNRIYPEPADNLHSFLLSATDARQLAIYAEQFSLYLQQDELPSINNLCFTSQVGRTALNERLAILVSSIDELKDKLAQWLADPKAKAHQDIYQGNIKSGGSGALIEGEAGKAYLNIVLQNRELNKLAKLWVDGIDIDWQGLYRGQSLKRVSLPVYPFVKERCWVETAQLPAAPVKPATVTPVVESKSLSFWLPQWQTTKLQANNQIEGNVLVLGADESLTKALAEQLPKAQLSSSLGDELPQTIVHVFNGDDLDSQLQNGIYALFDLCQQLLKRRATKPVQILSVFNGLSQPQHTALSGFFKTLNLENPLFSGRVVSADSELSQEAFVQRIVGELGDSSRQVDVCYHDGERLVRSFTTTQIDDSAAVPFKQGGVYIITGGLGGLGYLFAEQLINSCNARLVLLGRSELKDKQQQQIDKLGGEVLYISADVAKLEDMQNVVTQAKQKFGQVNGVLHSAGVNRDAYILKKSKDQIAQVLQPKVSGTLNLDLATKYEALDCFITFSSVSGAFGNLGQCDYAYGNHFQDAFAYSRQTLVANGERKGQTLSINWPFWAEGGMTLDAAQQLQTEQATGLCALPTEVGVNALNQLLSAGVQQAATLYGYTQRIDAYVNKVTGSAVKVSKVVTSIDPEALKTQTEDYLKGLVAQETKLSIERIYGDERFEAFGFDSVMIGRFNANLEKDLGELPKTLLYEYDTIDELSAYLVESAPDKLASLFNIEQQQVEVVTQPVAELVVAEPVAVTQQVAVEADEAIAIIGLHGDYPQSDSLDSFWSNLKKGRNLVQTVPENRWDKDAFYDPDPMKAAEGKIYCQWGSFVDGFDKFDAPFFNISKAEANNMDPQERLFLQSVWSALEDAGYTTESLKVLYPKDKSADVGVYVGVTTNSYQLLAADQWQSGSNVASPGNLPWSIANRVSYFFDFKGPSMPVDTACSSSLVAIHMACEALRSQACQLAVAGGVNLYLHPIKYHSLCQKGMVAKGDKCYSFGAGDDGFVPGEGVGTVVLKPLSRAIADNDILYGAIRGSGYDHSGRSNGYSAPNPNAQAALIAHTLDKANIPASSISYVEGHGTGTQLGDNLEITALTKAFAMDDKQVIPIGSVKGNLGHSESAAGITGLTKILLQMRHGELVPSINSQEVNPNIDFANSPFYLQHEKAPWNTPEGIPRRAMINSFGAGGVNASIIIEQVGRIAESHVNQGPYVIVLSAKNEDRLKAMAKRLLAFLNKNSDTDLANIAYTLQTGREAMEQRLACVVKDRNELNAKLGAFASGRQNDDIVVARAKRRRGKGKGVEQAVYQDLKQVGQKWAEGEMVDWSQLYPAGVPYRVSLPTYPFAQERHWVGDDSQVKPSSETAKVATIHPLVGNNCSTLKSVAFNSELSDEAFYATDHQVKSEKIFPGAGFMEIAAICGSVAGEQRISKIKDIVFIKPLSLKDGPQSVRTCLKTIGDATEFETNSLDDDMERVVHCEGRIYFQQTQVSVADSVSLDALKSLCGDAKPGSDYYKQFDAAGLNYGTCFQTIEKMYVNASFVLSKLVLDESLKADFDQYILHPSLIDGALQSVVGLTAGESIEDAVPHLPFALDEVEILRPLSSHCYALVELCGDGSSGAMKKFNIQLLSESGEVLVRLKSLYVRALQAPVSKGAKATGAKTAK